MKIIKIGGSVITNKKKPLTYRKGIIGRISEELKNKGPFIIVHGGGSFGHYAVKKYGLNSKGYCMTRYYMRVLNNMVVRDFLKHDILCTSISPTIIFHNNRYVKVIEEMINKNIFPITFGDVIIEKDSYRIVSGDELVVKIARDMNIGEIYFLVDVDGIFDERGKLIREIHIDEIREEIFFKTNDVTGGMLNKIRMLKKLKYGTVYILNGLKKGLLKDILEGKRAICTKIFIG